MYRSLVFVPILSDDVTKAIDAARKLLDARFVEESSPHVVVTAEEKKRKLASIVLDDDDEDEEELVTPAPSKIGYHVSLSDAFELSTFDAEWFATELKKVASQCDPLSIKLEFTKMQYLHQGEKVYCVVPVQDTPSLHQLHTRVSQLLKETLKCQNRFQASTGFIPHVTLAVFDDGSQCPEIPPQLFSTSPVVVWATEINFVVGVKVYGPIPLGTTRNLV